LRAHDGFLKLVEKRQAGLFLGSVSSKVLHFADSACLTVK